MKIFNPRHFLRYIAIPVLQDFVSVHPLGAHLTLNWNLPEKVARKALADAVDALQTKLQDDLTLTTAQKVALEEGLFSWNETGFVAQFNRRAHCP